MGLASFSYLSLHLPKSSNSLHEFHEQPKINFKFLDSQYAIQNAWQQPDESGRCGSYPVVHRKLLPSLMLLRYTIVVDNMNALDI